MIRTPNPLKSARWIIQLPITEKDAALASLVADGDRAVIAQLLQRYRKERCGDVAPASSTSRTVGELLQSAEAHAEERRRIEAKKRSQETARRQHEAAIAREKHLDAMAGREPQLWSQVESLVAAKTPKSYDLAIRILVGLRDLAARNNDGNFQSRVDQLRQTHSSKPSLIKRLKKAGL